MNFLCGQCATLKNSQLTIRNQDFEFDDAKIVCAFIDENIIDSFCAFNINNDTYCDSQLARVISIWLIRCGEKLVLDTQKDSKRPSYWMVKKKMTWITLIGYSVSVSSKL